MNNLSTERKRGPFTNIILQLLTPPTREIKLRGFCFTLKNPNIQEGFFVDVINNSETGVRRCSCEKSGNCGKEKEVTRNATRPYRY